MATPKTKKKVIGKPFKKGQSGNPGGRPRTSPAMKALNKLTVESYREIIELVMKSNVSEIKAIIKNPKTPGVKMAIATSFLKAIQKGDYAIVERIAERIIGKIPEQLTISPLSVTQKISLIDKDALRKAMDELEDEY